MRSLRLDDELEARIERAAAVRGESVSEFIRQAAADRAAATLAPEPVDFADVVGVVSGGGGRARRTGKAFADGIAADARRR